MLPDPGKAVAMQFKVAELREATGNFSKDREIGFGAFGCVYLAKNFRGAGTEAAIKVLNKVKCFEVLIMVTLILRQ